jgi:hypothetical protein
MAKRSEGAVSDRTAHVKLTERQWARLDQDEAKERKRRERVGDESSMDGYKVRRIRYLVSLGLLFEKHRRAERRAARVEQSGSVTP